MARRVLVVEDEPLPRRELCTLLTERGMQVVAEAESVAGARQALAEHRPELVFLDIQLGKETAFDLLEAVEADFEVVFVTAYDRYALRAFEVNAVDYLLKPVDPERLDETLSRLDGAPSTPPDGRPTALTLEDRLFVKDGRRWRFVQVERIKVIEADGDFTRLHLSDGREVMLGRPLREWEATLPPGTFVRIHRSTMVNLDYVIEVEEWFNRTFRVHVEGFDEPWAMSRRRAAKLKM
ncbi:MAG: LytTR family DNA-binding domain-containing protein [Gemmatimonadota bacterium]|jgi:two-component system LytT family response regulator